LITPPIATIPPGSEQILRVGLRRRLHPSRELAFRVFVQEVPAAAPALAPVGLRVAMRIGLPVFVLPDAGARPDLQFAIERSPGGGLRVHARNVGSAHAQIIGIEVRERDAGEPLARLEALHYILPGEGYAFIVEPALARASASMLHVKAHTDAGEFDADVPLAP
jgi:fimbrial chaperone protein